MYDRVTGKNIKIGTSEKPSTSYKTPLKRNKGKIDIKTISTQLTTRVHTSNGEN